MAHRVDLTFHRPIKESEVHKVRNFIEDVWVSASREGLVALDLLDERVNSMENFGFIFPAKQSHAVLTLIFGLVRSHRMDGLVDVVHAKKALADG